MAYKMKGFSGFKSETKASPNKFLGKFMRNTGVGKTLGKAAKYGAFGPLGMAAAAAGGAYKKKGAGSVPQHGDEAHGGSQPEAAAQQAAAAQQGDIPTNAPAVTGTEEQAPMMRRGVLTKGKKQVYKKEIKQLEDKISKTTNDAEISKLQKRVNDIRDKMAGHKIGDRPTPGEQEGFKGFKSR